MQSNKSTTKKIKKNKHYPLFVLLEQPEAAKGEIFIKRQTKKRLRTVWGLRVSVCINITPHYGSREGMIGR